MGSQKRCCWHPAGHREPFQIALLRNQILVILLLLAAILSANQSCASPTALQNSFESISQRAESARKADHVNDAIRLYREALHLRPGWQQGWLWLGNLLYDQDRFPEAHDAFAHFVLAVPQPGPVWAMKGLCEFEMQDYKSALADLETWVHGGFHGSDELTDVAAFHWALLLTRERRFAQALFVLTDRANRKGESPMLVEAMGLAALRIANLPSEYPQQLREPVWLAGKAAFFSSQHDFARSQEYGHRLLTAYSQTPNVHYFCGTLLNFQLKHEDAALEFRQELQLSPQHVPSLLELAQIEIDSYQIPEAVTLSRQAAEVELTNYDTHVVLGRALLAAGQLNESMEQLETARRLAPEVAAIHYHLAEAYRRMGRKEEAQREMSTYLSLGKKKGGALNAPYNAPVRQLSAGRQSE